MHLNIIIVTIFVKKISNIDDECSNNFNIFQLYY